MGAFMMKYAQFFMKFIPSSPLLKGTQRIHSCFVTDNLSFEILVLLTLKPPSKAEINSTSARVRQQNIATLPDHKTPPFLQFELSRTLRFLPTYLYINILVRMFPVCTSGNLEIF